MRSGCVQDAYPIVAEFFPCPVDAVGSPFESDAAVANDDVAVARMDLSKRHPVARPECPCLGYSVQPLRNDRSFDFTELGKRIDNRVHFSILLQSVQRPDEAVSNLVGHRDLPYLNSFWSCSSCSAPGHR